MKVIKTLAFILILFTGVSIFSQGFQKVTLNNQYSMIPVILDSNSQIIYLDLHNYGSDTVYISKLDSLYPPVPPKWTVNYMFTIDSTKVTPMWKASPNSAIVLYRIEVK